MASKYTNRNLMEYDFDENDYANLVTSKQQMTAADNAVKNYGDPKYARQQELENAINARQNLGKFSYDINGDALYQQYKDNYITQGKQAMMDTMGQAAAMTGGYGNSYAATVGNQTYQGYLQNLNNMIPQLQQMALDRYNAESNRLSENISILNADKANYLTEWELGYNKRVGERDYATTNYHKLYDNTLDNYNNQITANNEAYWNEYSAGYQAEQDSIANQRAAAELKLKQDAQTIAEMQAGVVRDKNGNIVSVPVGRTSADDSISDATREALKNAQTVEDVEDILGNLGLDNDVYDELLASYEVGKEGYKEKKVNSTPLKERDWTVVSKGGLNWGGGMDKNATVTDGVNTYTIKQLYEYLTDPDEMNGEPMSSDDAEAWLIKLQKKTGISWRN